jgi:hypothetical protein
MEDRLARNSHKLFDFRQILDWRRKRHSYSSKIKDARRQVRNSKNHKNNSEVKSIHILNTLINLKDYNRSEWQL